MENLTLTKKIHSFIASERLEDAIAELIKISEQFPSSVLDQEVLHEIYTISSSYIELQKLFRADMLDNEFYKMNRSKIIYRIVKVVDMIDHQYSNNE